MFFIKAETQGFGFFVAGKPCAGGMVEENLRLFSISLFAFPFLLFPAFPTFPALLSLFFRFSFSFSFSFSFLSFCPSFSRFSHLSRFALPLFFVFLSLSLSLSLLSALLFSALFLFPTLLSLFFSFLFPFFLAFFFPLFPPFPLCSPSFFRFSFPSFCPSFSRPFHLFRFALCV